MGSYNKVNHVYKNKENNDSQKKKVRIRNIDNYGDDDHHQ